MLQSSKEMLAHIRRRYPKTVVQPDGRSLVLTPLVRSDWPMVEQFLAGVLPTDRRYFRRGTTDPERIHEWCQQLNYEHRFPLVVWDGKEIVGEGILERDQGYWTSHVGRVRLLVKGSARRLDIGTLLLGELVELAKAFGLHRLACECAAGQFELIAFLHKRGFTQGARLKDYVRDQAGIVHDMVIMVYDLAQPMTP